MTEIDDFAAAARTWLASHAPDLEPLRKRGDTAAIVGAAREFLATMHDAGYSGITYPVEFGGQGRSAAFERAFREASRDFSLPMSPFAISLGMCGPTLLALGTDDQRRRYIRPLLRGEELWCQLFSEPGAGSDLAGLETRATRDPDGWVLTGQKVWTSDAQHADLGMILARTDPGAPKHAGITMFVVDMTQPAVTVRPLRSMNGTAHFNEVFIDGARVDDSAIIGGLNRGWQAAQVMLRFERTSISGGASPGGTVGTFEALSAFAKEQGMDADHYVREKLVALYIQEQAFELFGLRLKDEARAGNANSAKAAVGKVLKASLTIARNDLVAELRSDTTAYLPADSAAARRASSFLSAPGLSLGGGTNEIMKNIIGEKVLGLPREPETYPRDTPFRALRAPRSDRSGS